MHRQWLVVGLRYCSCGSRFQHDGAQVDKRLGSGEGK